MPNNKKKLLTSPNYLPLEKQKRKFGNYVYIIETKLPHFVLVVFTRADKNELPYTKPIIDAFEEENTGELAEQWQVIKIFQMKKRKERRRNLSDKDCSPWLQIFVVWVRDIHDRQIRIA